mmetsp:Transcript_13145/g.19333  ORF Transcript_13145/g.19333 Transcript_13145/m.19333 type:complete len:108 (-) Transcript_13145:218-541(-)
MNLTLRWIEHVGEVFKKNVHNQGKSRSQKNDHPTPESCLPGMVDHTEKTRKNLVANVATQNLEQIFKANEDSYGQDYHSNPCIGKTIWPALTVFIATGAAGKFAIDN